MLLEGMRLYGRGNDAVSKRGFQGRIVVSGGDSNLRRQLKFVESYDHAADGRLKLPQLVYCRRWHGLVAVKNNLYVIGGCKIWSFWFHFQQICSYQNTPNALQDNGATVFFIGSKIVVVGKVRNTKLCYDVEENTWTEIAFKYTEKPCFGSTKTLRKKKNKFFLK